MNCSRNTVEATHVTHFQAIEDARAELEALGWHVETSDTACSVHRRFKNGKPRKSPAVIAFYSPVETGDVYVDLDGSLVEEPRVCERPYVVRVEDQNVCRFYDAQAAERDFLRAARSLVVNPDSPEKKALVTSVSANGFGRRYASDRNELHQSLGALCGIATGLLSDRHLSDDEIRFLSEWMDEHEEVAYAWPGDIIHARVKSVLADGVISDEERAHLVGTLNDLLGKHPGSLAKKRHVTELAYDDVDQVIFEGRRFCLTGDFVFAPRSFCEAEILKRGGLPCSSISSKLHYVVVGSLGSPEWKFGSWGTKIDKAMDLRQRGVPIVIVREDTWALTL
jgi:hypothetical protein